MTRSKFRQQVFVGKDVTNSLGAIPPQQNDGTAVAGIAIDRRGIASGKFVFETAAPTGTPTTAAALIKIQHSATTTAGDFVDFISLETALDISAAAIKEYCLDLGKAKRYIRAYIDTTYTGGTSPKNIFAGEILFGDYDIDPKSAETIYKG